MEKISFRQAVEQTVGNDTTYRPEIIHFRLFYAREWLWHGLAYFFYDPQWLPEYEQIVDWLTDNHGKGLLCMGNLGRGKTIICTKIIPVLMDRSLHRKVYALNVSELNARFDVYKNYKYICIDDIGSEYESVKYGEHRIPVAEMVDIAEKEGNLLILTTNLTVSELAAKYGERTVDRLRAITQIVLFQGKSLRK